MNNSELEVDSKVINEFSPFPMLTIDSNGNILNSNNLMQTMLKSTEEEIKTSIFDYIYPQDIKGFKNLLLETIHSESHQPFEVRGYQNAKIMWLKGTAKKYSSKGQPIIVLHLENITDQKYTQSLLEINKSILKMIVTREPISKILEEISLQIDEHLLMKTFCTFVLLGHDNHTIESVIAPNLPLNFTNSLKGIKIGPKVGSCGTAMYQNEIIISSDLFNDPLWEGYLQLVQPLGLQSCWSVPVTIENDVVGAFAIYHPQPTKPTTIELEMIQYLAELVASSLERNRVEQKVIFENEKRFHALIDNIPDVVIFKNEQEHWIELNKKALGVFSNYSKRDSEGRITDLVFNGSPLLEKLSKQTDTKTLGQENMDRLEVGIPLIEGNTLNYDFIKSPYYDENNSLQGEVFLGRDMTDRKKIELLLEESEQKYRSLFEYNPNMIFSIDLKGKILSYNKSFLDTMGYSEQEILSMESFNPLVVPEYLEHTRKHYLDALNGTPQKYETVVYHKNGQLIYLQVINVPIIVQGDIIGVFGIAEDITVLKRVIEEQRQTKELLESIFENSGDCIAVLTFDGKVNRVSPAAKDIYGWGDEMIGVQFPTLPEDLKDEMNHIIQEIKHGNQVIGLETRRIKKDRREISVSVTYSPLRDNKGSIIGIISISRDISGKKETENLLNRAEKLAVIGQLSAAVAHEVRNPLTTIKGFIQLYQGKIKSDIHELMLTEIEQIETIVTEFLSLAKPQVTEFKILDISTIVNKTMAILEKQAIYNQVILSVRFEENLPQISCNEPKIKQVLINLVKNAIESMGNMGTLSVDIKKMDSNIIICIKDEGCGIPLDKIDKLGEPFYSNKEKGTGLGLMVCFKIIEEHHGKIEFDSEEGKGTTVTIYLPI